MQDDSKRFVTIVLGLAIAVLAIAIFIGERAGDRVIGQVTEKRLESIAPITVTPAPLAASTAPYGPDWKRSDVMAAAGDPGFPDPRVPAVPLPPPLPAPAYHPQPLNTVRPAPATATPNLNLPIWRRAAPLPTAQPLETALPSPNPAASPETAATPRSERGAEPSGASRMLWRTRSLQSG